jgi:hypothetical protein
MGLFCLLGLIRPLAMGWPGAEKPLFVELLKNVISAY